MAAPGRIDATPPPKSSFGSQFCSASGLTPSSCASTNSFPLRLGVKGSHCLPDLSLVLIALACATIVRSVQSGPSHRHAGLSHEAIASYLNKYALGIRPRDAVQAVEDKAEVWSSQQCLGAQVDCLDCWQS